MSLPTDKEIDDAIRRIALSSDGRLLYRRFQMVLMEVSPSADDGALRTNHGRRSLARELKSLMDSELSKAGPERARPGEPHDPDAAAVTRPAESVAVSRPGTERRVQPYAEPSKPT